MSHDTLSDVVDATARAFAIPGVSVGVWADGRERYACHGVTSIENPLPLDQDTLFCLGSISKTYTATAVMRLVAQGRSNREIGRVLHISEHTAANHIRSILRKSRCANRTEAAAYALRHGLVPD